MIVISYPNAWASPGNFPGRGLIFSQKLFFRFLVCVGGEKNPPNLPLAYAHANPGSEGGHKFVLSQPKAKPPLNRAFVTIDINRAYGSSAAAALAREYVARVFGFSLRNLSKYIRLV